MALRISKIGKKRKNSDLLQNVIMLQKLRYKFLKKTSIPTAKLTK